MSSGGRRGDTQGAAARAAAMMRELRPVLIRLKAHVTREGIENLAQQGLEELWERRPLKGTHGIELPSCFAALGIGPMRSTL